MQNKQLFYKAEFITSAARKDQFKTDHSAVTLMGRSNVGKSTLINSLTKNGNLMKTSKKPGRTQLVNYALINDKFYLVDVPGYGFASFKRDTFEGLMKDFIEDNKCLKKIYILIDSRRLLQDGDIEFADYLENLGIRYAYIFTKCDKLNTSEKHFLDLQIQKINEEKSDVKCFISSIKDDKNLDLIRQDMIKVCKK